MLFQAGRSLGNYYHIYIRHARLVHVEKQTKIRHLYTRIAPYLLLHNMRIRTCKNISVVFVIINTVTA